MLAVAPMRLAFGLPDAIGPFAKLFVPVVHDRLPEVTSIVIGSVTIDPVIPLPRSE
jgi:hypothetical protein